MKKLILLVLTISLGFMFIGCDQKEDNIIETNEQLFTLEALSSTSLLNYNQTSVVETAFVPLSDKANNQPQPRITQEVEDIDYYVEMMEVFLGDDNLEVVLEESDKEEYSYKTTYSTLNLLGEEVSYVLYYNQFIFEENQETPITTNTESTEATTTTETTEATSVNSEIAEVTTTTESTQATHQRDFHFNDEDDHLTVQGIEGILIYGETTYNIEGKKIVNDNQEIFRLRSFVDSDNFVLVNYQTDIDDDEKEKFFFKLVEDGEVVKESKVMIFAKDNHVHARLEMTEDDNYGRYLFNIRTDENVQYININYEVRYQDEVTEKGNIRLVAETDTVTGEVVYTFKVRPDNSENQYEETKRHQTRPNPPMMQNR